MLSGAFSSKNVQHANNYFIPNQDWYQIFVLQKSQLLIVSSPVSQDKAHFDTSSDELEVVRTLPLGKHITDSKETSILTKSGQMPSPKKKLGTLSFNYVQIADQT